MFHARFPTLERVFWKESLTRGDIVSFAFPIENPRPWDIVKPRPCLVLDIARHDGRREAVIAYGTDFENTSNRGHEIRVRHEADIRALGLRKPTRFVCARRLIVPLDHGAFRCSAEGTPVIGRLTPPLLARLEKVLADLAFEAAVEQPTQSRRADRCHRPCPARSAPEAAPHTLSHQEN
jgi:hypothetical protein